MINREVLTAHCTGACRITEVWMGATLYGQRITHRHGPIQWGGYDAHTLGMDCAHLNEDTCPGLRDRLELTAAGAL